MMKIDNRCLLLFPKRTTVSTDVDSYLLTVMECITLYFECRVRLRLLSSDVNRRYIRQTLDCGVVWYDVAQTCGLLPTCRREVSTDILVLVLFANVLKARQISDGRICLHHSSSFRVYKYVMVQNQTHLK